jgi:Tol biopolymer transport system component
VIGSVLVVALWGSASAVAAPLTTRVSVSSFHLQANSASPYNYRPVFSRHGRYVAFVSHASNLVAGDTNKSLDVFWRDRLTGVTKRVSVSTSGVQGNGNSIDPSISADGNLVAFSSGASNFVAADPEGGVFLRSISAGTTRLLSISAGGVSGDGFSGDPVISGNGRYVAFSSGADNLVPGDDNLVADIFVKDLVTGEITRVSRTHFGGPADADSYAPAISRAGRYVAFLSYADNLVAGDTNFGTDVFVRDRQAHTTTRVSVSTTGAQADSFVDAPRMSADGRYVVFDAYATNLVPNDQYGDYDVFVHDQTTGTTTLVDVTSSGVQAKSGAVLPDISADGRYIVFTSTAANLGAGANGVRQVFLHDQETGQTRLVSVAMGGGPGNDGSYTPGISPDARWIGFPSDATDLIAHDTNGKTDVYARGPLFP